MPESYPAWAGSPQLTACATQSSFGRTWAASSATVKGAHDLTFSASLMMSLAPAMTANTPASEPPPPLYLDESAARGQVFWLVQFSTKLDYVADDTGTRIIAKETVIWANQEWQSGFAFRLKGRWRQALSGAESLAPLGWVTSSLCRSDTDGREFIAACQEAVSFAQRLSAGLIEKPSTDLLALAKQVVQQQQRRQAEDVQPWAERLARDVGDAVD
jgi:hypothetical protein